jgi:hypothetical protein
MRTLLLVGCAALAAATTTVRAQTDRAAITIYGGLTSATLHGDSVPGPLHRAGFAAGAAVSWPIASHFAVQPELQFAQKGDDETDSYSGGIFSMHIRLNYIEIPVLLRASTSLDRLGFGEDYRRVVPFLVAGPQISFKTSCSIDVQGLPGNYTCADLPAARTTDWGFVAGGGVELPVMSHAISVGARYDWGLRDAFVNNIAKTRTFSALIGWRVR